MQVEIDCFFSNKSVQLGEYLARGASSSTSSTLFDYLNNYTTTFVVNMVRHEGLLQLPLRRHVFGSRGFLIYLGNINIDLVDIDFRLRLRRLHRRRLGCGSRGFIVYLTDVDSSFIFINMYFVTRDARDQGLRHNHRTRGASGIRMSGVTPKHEVLPGDCERRGRGD
jgi:hypothetical protein